MTASSKTLSETAASYGSKKKNIEHPKFDYILPYCALPKQKLQNIQIKLFKKPIEILTHTLIASQRLMQTGPNMSAGYYGFHAPNATAFNTSKLNYNCHNNLDLIHAQFCSFPFKNKRISKNKDLYLPN